MASVYDQGSIELESARDTLQEYDFNGVFTAIPVSKVVPITVGPDGADIFIAGTVQVRGMDIEADALAASALGGYLIDLERSTDNFASSSNTTRLSSIGGIAFFSTATSSYQLEAGGSISYIEKDVEMGTYYYRLSFRPQGRGLSNSSYYLIDQTDLNIIRFDKRQQP
jgi:hypothetical protein